MAYRRSITHRVKLFYQQQHRLTPLFSHSHRHDTDGEEFPARSVSRNFEIRSCIQNRFLGTKSTLSNFQRSSNFVRCGLVFGRSFSSPSVGEGVAEGFEFYSDAVEAAATNVTPVVSEVAVAAADSAFPVAAVQYLIDYIHCYTGFNWWASIVVATVLVRCFQIPFDLFQLKAVSKFDLPKLRKEILAIRKTLEKGDSDVARANKLMMEYVIYPQSASFLLSGAIYSTFFFALRNMADKVPSFKEGGILWFTDLTTPDYMFVFPLLMASTLCYNWKLNARGNKPVQTPIDYIGLVNCKTTLLSILFLVFFPKVLFCHWITSRLFFMAFTSVMERPEVQKLLGLSIATFSTNKKTKA